MQLGAALGAVLGGMGGGGGSAPPNGGKAKAAATGGEATAGAGAHANNYFNVDHKDVINIKLDISKLMGDIRGENKGEVHGTTTADATATAKSTAAAANSTSQAADKAPSESDPPAPRTAHTEAGAAVDYKTAVVIATQAAAVVDKKVKKLSSNLVKLGEAVQVELQRAEQRIASLESANAALQAEVKQLHDAASKQQSALTLLEQRLATLEGTHTVTGDLTVTGTVKTAVVNLSDKWLIQPEIHSAAQYPLVFRDKPNQAAGKDKRFAMWNDKYHDV